jgi:AcrR family transcriptional regulator
MPALGTKARILRAANRRLQKGGISRLSMRTIAADLGITPMALYRHFRDKDELLDALSQDALNEWLRRLQEIGSESPLKWLHESFERFLAFALDSPTRFEAAFLLPAPKARRFPDDITLRRSPTLTLMMNHIERAQFEGSFCRDESPEYIAMTFWALAQGLVALFRAGRFTGATEFRDFYLRVTARCIASFRRS